MLEEVCGINRSTVELQGSEQGWKENFELEGSAEEQIA